MTAILFKPCALCGHFPDPDNYIDSFHQTAQGWRDDEISPGKMMRHYMRWDDPRGVHGYTHEMNCLEHEGGCSMNVRGDTREETIEKWNCRPDEDAFDSIHGRTIVGWIYRDVFRLATATDDVTELMNLEYEPIIKVPPSCTFTLPEGK
jgi:hypothetical protein